MFVMCGLFCINFFPPQGERGEVTIIWRGIRITSASKRIVFADTIFIALVSRTRPEVTPQKYGPQVRSDPWQGGGERDCRLIGSSFHFRCLTRTQSPEWRAKSQVTRRRDSRATSSPLRRPCPLSTFPQTLLIKSTPAWASLWRSRL